MKEKVSFSSTICWGQLGISISNDSDKSLIDGKKYPSNSTSSRLEKEFLWEAVGFSWLSFDLIRQTILCVLNTILGRVKFCILNAKTHQNEIVCHKARYISLPFFFKVPPKTFFSMATTKTYTMYNVFCYLHHSNHNSWWFIFQTFQTQLSLSFFS